MDQTEIKSSREPIGLLGTSFHNYYPIHKDKYG